MSGQFALILHAHLPFVRHPEHERFLEEAWLYEAILETYLPLLELLERWRADRLNVRLTLSLSPTLSTMLLDPLLQARFESRLNGLVELAEKEVFRTHFDAALRPLAEFYRERFVRLRELWRGCDRDLVGAFASLQAAGRLEIITCSATHALLPLLARNPGSLRAQVRTAQEHHRALFGRDPVGLWLPECAYAPEIEGVLQDANIRWFVLDSHGLLNASPRPRYGTFAPVFTPNGLAAFGRDFDSARQVWSRQAGYPGDPRYRDFYRDVGFDLDFEYVRPYLPSPEHRGFTGIKYHRITRGGGGAKEVYDLRAAAAAAREHAAHFLAAQLKRLTATAQIMDRPPLVVAPYDAELFGHWWFEGLQFLDAFVRGALASGADFTFTTPTDYLRQNATLQVVRPKPSTWGEGGHYAVWLNEKNEWIQPHLRAAEERMTDLAKRFLTADDLTARALRQAGRELLLAQASDWPFILHTGTGPEYATRRVKEHLLRFFNLHEQLLAGRVSAASLQTIEEQGNLFPHLDYLHWA